MARIRQLATMAEGTGQYQYLAFGSVVAPSGIATQTVGIEV